MKWWILDYVQYLNKNERKGQYYVKVLLCACRHTRVTSLHIHIVMLTSAPLPWDHPAYVQIPPRIEKGTTFQSSPFHRWMTLVVRKQFLWPAEIGFAVAFTHWHWCYPLGAWENDFMNLYEKGSLGTTFPLLLDHLFSRLNNFSIFNHTSCNLVLSRISHHSPQSVFSSSRFFQQCGVVSWKKYSWSHLMQLSKKQSPSPQHLPWHCGEHQEGVIRSDVFSQVGLPDKIENSQFNVNFR